MIRETSREAYNKIKDDGLLSERRWQVYDVLHSHGPATGNELLLEFRKKYGRLYGNSPVVTSRLGELRDLGVAYEVRERPCNVTGHSVIEWAVTDNLPKVVSKRRTLRHRLLVLVEDLANAEMRKSVIAPLISRANELIDEAKRSK